MSAYINNKDSGTEIIYHFFAIGWCSLVIMVVIFFINAHMLIPTISGIMGTKDEQKICSQWFWLPLTTISESTILEFGSNSAYSLHFSINSLRFIMFIKAKLGTGVVRAIKELVSLFLSSKIHVAPC